MAEMHDDDYEWQPPSEAEMKIIQARRERSDKISKLMGDYLLKGWKMLGASCRTCNTILLQDKQGTNYCIACQELDTDVDKDDPVLNSAAARSQILEGSQTDPSDTDDLSYMGRRQPSTKPQQSPADTAPPQTVPSITPASVASSGVFSLAPASNAKVNVNFVDSAETLCQKIQWATEELKKTSSVEYSMNLCQMIRCAADALYSLKQAS